MIRVRRKTAVKTKKKKQEHWYLDIKMDSFLEVYFALWLDELKDLGYIDKWTYQETTFKLFSGLKLPYLKQLKTKVKENSEAIFPKASYTEDFTIYWNKSSANLFYLDHSEALEGNVNTIPFRLGNGVDLISYVDVKSTNASTTSSSVSQPYKAKWVYEKYGILIHKIYPFSLGKSDYKKTLFYKTFFPNKVLIEQVYLRDCKYGVAGESKIKYGYKTVKDFLNGNK